jgi:SAM-dependent methyltransferase
MTSNPHQSLAPSLFIERFAGLVCAGARVLDLACGYGRHALMFAAREAQVVAVDRDEAALASFSGTAGIETRQCDLEAEPWPFPGERFDAIVVSHYLYRPLFVSLRSALAADGVLLYETFAQGNEAFGRPANPAFLLRPGELLEFAAGGPQPMAVVAFEQGRVRLAGRVAVVQRIAAVGSARAWPPVLDDPAPTLGT